MAIETISILISTIISNLLIICAECRRSKCSEIDIGPIHLKREVQNTNPNTIE